MGLIKPNAVSKIETKKIDRRILDNALAEYGAFAEEDEQGVICSNADRLARRLWNTALYAESDKDATTAAKIIYERMNGKPKVLVDEEKEELPEITFRVNASDAAKVKALSMRDDVEEEPNDKIVVEIEGEPRMEF